MRCIVSLLVGLFVLSSSARGVDGVDEPIMLPNGLRVFLLPQAHAEAEAVALVTLFDIGERHDPEGQSGLSHMVEHFYVTSAAGAGYPSRSADAWMRSYAPPLGVNAQTGEDYTVIATVFRPEDLASEIEESAARMHRIEITPMDMARELPRLQMELDNMYGGMPVLGAVNLARQNIRPMSESGRKGGLVQHMARLQPRVFQSHYDDYYKPNNAIVVLAGAFDPDEALEMIREAYADVPAGALPPPESDGGEGLPGSTARVTVRPSGWPAGSPYSVALAYNAPAPTSAHYPAFLVMMGDLYRQAMQGRRGFDSMPVVFAPLDDPGFVAFGAGVEDDDAAVAELHAMRARIADAVPAEGAFVNTFVARNMFGHMLGIQSMPAAQAARNPYLVAFAHGRRHQLGVDAEALKAAMGELTAADIAACHEAVFGVDQSAAVILKVAEEAAAEDDAGE